MMKKYLITISAFLLALMQSFAQIAPNPSIPNDPVDYSRLRLPSDEPSIPALFTMRLEGEDDHTQMMNFLTFLEKQDSVTVMENVMHCRGELVHSYNITPDFVEWCIKRALIDSRLDTRDELARLIAATPELKEYRLSTEQWANDMLNLAIASGSLIIPMGRVGGAIYGAGSTAVGYASSALTDSSMDAIDHGLNAGGLSVTAYQTIVNPKELSKAGKISKGLGTAVSVAQLAKMTYAQFERDQQKCANWVHLLNMCRIDYFYNLVNKYLREGAGAYQKVWLLAISPESKTLPFNYRGEMCSVTWKIAGGALKLIPLPKYYGDPRDASFEGEYFGYLNAVADFDLSNYDSNYVGKTTVEDVLGLNGDSENPFVNIVAESKPIVAADAVRSSLNGYKVDPLYSVSGVKNGASQLKITYASPMYVKIEMNDSPEVNFLEISPTYFWDLVEFEDDPLTFNKEGVMDAMGLTQSSKEGDVKLDYSFEKGFTAISEKLGHKVVVKEGVKGGKYSFYESDSRSGITSFEHSAKEALNASGPGDYISYTIPPGKFTLFLTQEIQPAPREALETTKEDWAELFKKYNLKMNLK